MSRLSRLGKQERPLAELEREPSRFLRQEPVVVADSGKMGVTIPVPQMALRRLGTIKEDTDDEELERLEKAILKVRDTLGPSVHGGPVRIVQDWTERISSLSEDGDRRAFAKSALEKLPAEGTVK